MDARCTVHPHCPSFVRKYTATQKFRWRCQFGGDGYHQFSKFLEVVCTVTTCTRTLTTVKAFPVEMDGGKSLRNRGEADVKLLQVLLMEDDIPGDSITNSCRQDLHIDEGLHIVMCVLASEPDDWVRGT